ncbi:DUF397 domain-containing protein [Streptomyces sp. NPDC050610]|uniref:DUF397 domain-containing protein n=1 Tax=Streptomyces sp. NPDC050610 TaxID=3157097 RepID=UPI00341938E5
MTVFEFVKSSHSGPHPDQECVEVAVNVPGTVAIRDSKTPTGPTLRITPAAWLAFQEAVVRDGRADIE